MSKVPLPQGLAFALCFLKVKCLSRHLMSKVPLPQGLAFALCFLKVKCLSRHLMSKGQALSDRYALK